MTSNLATNRPVRQIHPFPARMAPELALEAVHRAPRNATVLDPMCGSGTVLKHAIEQGRRALGFDLDPLAVLLSRVACTPVSPHRLIPAAEQLVALSSKTRTCHLPWIDADGETQDFIDYWFDTPQQTQLRKLASLLAGKRGKIADALRVALSRTIITKDRGASLARDVSHSRPHRVRDDNDFDVFKGFLASARKIATLLEDPTRGPVNVRLGDARRLPTRLHGTVDLVVTSPPYLNAIDYMRGHRLSLVWMGYRLSDLREIRSSSIGAERGISFRSEIAKELVPRHSALSRRQQAMLDRYAFDTYVFMGQIARVLAPGGQAVIIIGDSNIGGAYVRNSSIVETSASSFHLRQLDRRSRKLPASSRYLPPPVCGAGPMSKRMNSEVILRFQKSPRHC